MNLIIQDNPKYIKKLYLRANSAEPAPPLGTILGNIGVNSTAFCTLFNNKTENLPNYFLLKTTIFIYENKSTNLIVDFPSISYFLTLLKFEKTIKIKVLDRMHEKLITCVKLYHSLQISKLKYPHSDLKTAFFIVLGTCYSMKLTIVD